MNEPKQVIFVYDNGFKGYNLNALKERFRIITNNNKPKGGEKK